MEGSQNSYPPNSYSGDKDSGDKESLSLSLAIDRTELIKVILRSLYSLGYPRAAAALELESGIPLDPPELAALLSHALSGRWLDCAATIDRIPDLEAETRSVAAFLVWREHFLELLGSTNDLLLAKEVLASRISPLELDRRRVHGLARALVLSEGSVPPQEMIERRIRLWLDIVEVMPPWVRVPDGRLEHLLETAVLKQVDSCLYHNSPEEATLYEDHACSHEQIPSKCIQTLYDHRNEVWFVQFSNKGQYLASSSKDCTAIIWTVEEDDTLSVKHALEGHVKPVSFIAWSPDDTLLLTCGNGEVLKLWDVDAGSCKLTFKGPINRVISSCAWFPNSAKIACGSYQPDNRIYTCDVEGNELEVWEGERIPKVSDLAVTPDGRYMISICSNREIWIHDMQKGKERIVHEENSITSLSLSRDGQFMIVNLNSEEIHLWRVHGSSNRPDRFIGHKQGKYVIRSCFGGSDCLFIASGSEDSQVYVWHRHHEMPIQILSGHSMTVNCVSWNPMKPHMLVSASDDCSIRVWVAIKKSNKIHT